MKYYQIIDYVDSAYPNPFDVQTKLLWMCEADGIIRTEVHGQPLDTIPQTLSQTDTASLPVPHTRIYSYYLFAMISYFLSDYDRYKISSEMFEKAIEIYAKWYIRHGEA